ncbi:hypothetical protein [Anaeromyxobacter oryzisoli]|uniref:hypothetical protein n=1 Tax=Anaeromyxobacter oryzisoli TaxID=2925408 RepID=UPI001F5AB920|nr:hypothetical protein [Anaeromyxobacter sp. SG63]
MSERWLGITVSGAEVVAVDLDVPATGPLVVIADNSFRLDTNEDRATAYLTIHRRISQYVQERNIRQVVVKKSATTRQAATLALLESAELRGVVAAGAAGGGAKVLFAAKAQLSKSFGARKVDEYLKDDSFWTAEITGTLKHGSREAAFIVLCEVRPRDA